MPDTGGKPESDRTDPEQLRRLIDAELAEKRIVWQKAAARRQKVRVASVLFLFLLIIGSLVAFFRLFMRINQERANSPPNASPSMSGH